MAIAVLTVATLTATSAFAETRHSEGTRRGRDSVRRERSEGRDSVRRSDESRNSARSAEQRQPRESYRDRTPSRETTREAYRERSSSRESTREAYRDRSSSRSERSYSDRSYGDRSYDSRRYDSHRDRGYSSRGSVSQHRSYGGSRQPYYARGRVSRILPYGGGYRVFVAGAPYPFFIPLSHWHRDRFRVGVSINIGGIYNPGGYYDYYGYDRYDRYSAGELRGTVESVDYRRDTFVVRNDATGSFVTVVMRDRRGNVRAGDYVELYGDWSRNGVLQARDVDVLD